MCNKNKYTNYKEKVKGKTHLQTSKGERLDNKRNNQNMYVVNGCMTV